MLYARYRVKARCVTVGRSLRSGSAFCYRAKRALCAAVAEPSKEALHSKARVLGFETRSAQLGRAFPFRAVLTVRSRSSSRSFVRYPPVRGKVSNRGPRVSTPPKGGWGFSRTERTYERTSSSSLQKSSEPALIGGRLLRLWEATTPGAGSGASRGPSVVKALQIGPPNPSWRVRDARGSRPGSPGPRRDPHDPR